MGLWDWNGVLGLWMGLRLSKRGNKRLTANERTYKTDVISRGSGLWHVLWELRGIENQTHGFR